MKLLVKKNLIIILICLMFLAAVVLASASPQFGLYGVFKMEPETAISSEDCGLPNCPDGNTVFYGEDGWECYPLEDVCGASGEEDVSGGEGTWDCSGSEESFIGSALTPTNVPSDPCIIGEEEEKITCEHVEPDFGMEYWDCKKTLCECGEEDVSGGEDCMEHCDCELDQFCDAGNCRDIEDGSYCEDVDLCVSLTNNLAMRCNEDNEQEFFPTNGPICEPANVGNVC